MILGLSLSLFTKIHVFISIVAIGAGLVVAWGMIAGKLMPAIASLFLITTVLTSVTGFMFPFHGVTPGIIVGTISLVLLLIAMVAFYGKHAVGAWRRPFVITAMIALFFNCLVLIIQSFMKIAPLHALAPTGNEMPVKLSQVVLLILFVVLTYVADKKYRPATA
jgi:hypothetical protein